jgi:hypothetical protein
MTSIGAILLTDAEGSWHRFSGMREPVLSVQLHSLRIPFSDDIRNLINVFGTSLEAGPNRTKNSCFIST